MDNTDAARNALHGKTISEKLASIGIEQGRIIEIRNLNGIGRDYGIDVYLFFEKDLATTRTLAQVEEEYRGVPEYERPYVRVDHFLRFTQENDPSFSRTLDEFPLMIEIVSVSELPDPAPGRVRPVVTGLMPFLDEFDVDVDPADRAKEHTR
jgi:hypothetical protein